MKFSKEPLLLDRTVPQRRLVQEPAPPPQGLQVHITVEGAGSQGDAEWQERKEDITTSMQELIHA